MSDDEFLGYCAIHCLTERALFNRAQVDRLRLLAGLDEIKWDGTYPEWMGLGPGSIMPAVNAARERVEKSASM